MSIFKHHTNKYTVIIGCGRLGASLANRLSEQNKDVLIIDKEESAFRKLASEYAGLTLTGDARDITTLKDAHIDSADVIVSVTNYDNTNIMVAQIAKELYQIPHVIARLYDPQRACVYREFHIDTICPAILSAKEIVRILQDDVYTMEEGMLK